MLRIKIPNEIMNNPDGFTLQHLQDIGRAYLEEYNLIGITGFILGLFHTNHPIALKMCHYADDATPIKLWTFLAKIYEELPNNNGKLAKTILEYFKEAYGEKILTHCYIPTPPAAATNFPLIVEYETKNISAQLQAFVCTRMFVM